MNHKVTKVQPDDNVLVALSNPEEGDYKLQWNGLIEGEEVIEQG